MMKSIESKIFTTLQNYSMLGKGNDVILAVSGGADSMCLLHFFSKFSDKLKISKLICAHVNHGIRGKEADRDEEFVRSFCELHNIEFAVKRCDIPAVAEITGESIELCARRIRYEFFSTLSNDAVIATAHNLNDSAETFILNLVRGTALKGLTGIPPVRDNIIRPLSACTREEIETYLSEEGIDFVTDSTNCSDEYTRNRIRHNVIPVLCEMNPSFFRTFLSCIDTLSDTEKFLDSVTDSVFNEAKTGDKFSSEALMDCDEVIRRRVFVKIAEYYGVEDIEKKHILLLSDILDKKGAVMLHNRLKLASDGKYIYLENEKLPADDICSPILSGISIYEFNHCIIEFVPASYSEIEGLSVRKAASMGYIRASALENAVFRSRKNGDRFMFPSAEHSKSLKNLFKENNISVADRNGIPFIADDKNILWIDKIGVSDFACIKDNTEDIYKIKVSRKVDVL